MLFADESCDTQVLATGTQEECLRLADTIHLLPYSGGKTVVASHIVVRPKRAWDQIIAEAESEERAAQGIKPS